MKLRDYYDSLNNDQKIKFIRDICIVCGLKKVSVKNFIYGIRKVSGKNCETISVLTQDKVKPFEMRPDIFKKID